MRRTVSFGLVCLVLCLGWGTAATCPAEEEPSAAEAFEALLRENDLSRAQRLFNELRKVQPDSLEANLGLYLLSMNRGRPSDAVSCARILLEKHRAHPLIDSVVADLETLWQFGADFADLVPVLVAIAQDPNVPLPTRIEVAKFLISYFVHYNDVAALAKVRWPNCPPSFLVAGPFGAFDDLSFQERFPPEGGMRLDSEFPRARLFRTPTARPTANGVLRLNAPEHNGSFYAQTHLHVSKDAEVRFIVITADAVKMFLDGRLCVAKNPLTQHTQRATYLSAQLKAGDHSLVLKCLSPEGGVAVHVAVDSPDPDAELRFFVDRDPEAPAGFKTEGAPDGCLRQLRLPLEEFVESDSVQVPVALRWALLGLRRSSSHETEAAKKALARALADYPDSALFALFNCRIYQADASLVPDQRRSIARREALRASSLCPDLAGAYLLLSGLDMAEGQSAAAIETHNEAQQRGAEDYVQFIRRAELCKAQGWTQEAFAALRQAQAVSKDRCLADHKLWELYLEQSAAGVPDELVEQLDETHGDLDEYAQGRALARGDYTGVVALGLRRREHLGEQMGSYERFTDKFADRMDAAQLQAYWQTGADDELEDHLREQSATETSVAKLSLLASLARAGGLSALAEELEDKAERLNPSASVAFHRFFGAASDCLLDRLRIDGLEVIAADALRDHGDATSVQLLDHEALRVLDNLKVVGTYHCVAKVLKRKGLDEWGKVTIPPAAHLLLARTVKADGMIVEPDYQSGSTITMSGLEPGDCVEYEYIMMEPGQFETVDGYTSFRWYFATRQYPVECSRLDLIAPPNLPVSTYFNRFPVRPDVSTLEGLRVYSWQKGPSAKLPDEASSPQIPKQIHICSSPSA